MMHGGRNLHTGGHAPEQQASRLFAQDVEQSGMLLQILFSRVNSNGELAIEAVRNLL